jgi:GxxExxY protein
LEKEFAMQDIPFETQQTLRLYYKGIELQKTYMPDFVCYGKIIVELKAVNNIAGEHKAQILNYLKASGFKLGLLVNFGCHPKATVERFVW